MADTSAPLTDASAPPIINGEPNSPDITGDPKSPVPPPQSRSWLPHLHWWTTASDTVPPKTMANTGAAPHNKDEPSSAHTAAASTALENLVSRAGDELADDPKNQLIQPADHQQSHSWMRLHWPTGADITALENWFRLGNYVLNRETGEKTWEPMAIYVRLGMHLMYYGNKQEKVLHWKRTQDVLKQQSIKMGEQYDSPASKAQIKPFIASFGLEEGMKEMVQPDPDAYDTFNQFFAREIREDARPIAEPEDESVVSSPADCRLTAFPTVDLATEYWIKGDNFTLGRLLGSDELAQRFDGGSLVIARLAPQDYHRWHSPTAGMVEKVEEIPGAYYTVNPQAINETGPLDVFCENRRSVMILKRKTTGSPVAVVAVGACLVGSIKYNPGVEVGAEVRRGQCLGAFYYGGSTVIVVYPKDEVVLDEDLVKNSTEKSCETLVKVGWRVGAGPQ